MVYLIKWKVKGGITEGFENVVFQDEESALYYIEGKDDFDYEIIPYEPAVSVIETDRKFVEIGKKFEEKGYKVNWYE